MSNSTGSNDVIGPMPPREEPRVSDTDGRSHTASFEQLVEYVEEVRQAETERAVGELARKSEWGDEERRIIEQFSETLAHKVVTRTAIQCCVDGQDTASTEEVLDLFGIDRPDNGTPDDDTDAHTEHTELDGS